MKNNIILAVLTLCAVIAIAFTCIAIDYSMDLNSNIWASAYIFGCIASAIFINETLIEWGKRKRLQRNRPHSRKDNEDTYVYGYSITKEWRNEDGTYYSRTLAKFGTDHEAALHVLAGMWDAYLVGRNLVDNYGWYNMEDAHRFHNGKECIYAGYSLWAGKHTKDCSSWYWMRDRRLTYFCTSSFSINVQVYKIYK